jgi:hypothetical protein
MKQHMRTVMSLQSISSCGACSTLVNHSRYALHSAADGASLSGDMTCEMFLTSCSSDDNNDVNGDGDDDDDD